MGASTGIEWTDATWNPWYGCHKVSQGCKRCYMFSGMKRYGRVIRTWCGARSDDVLRSAEVERCAQGVYLLLVGFPD